MKTIIFVCVFVSLGVFIETASTKKCTTSPLTGHHQCNDLKPKHCHPPVCGKNQDGDVKWFKNNCYLINYNTKCHTNYKPASDSLCNSTTKPKTPEIEKEPCGHTSTSKPETQKYSGYVSTSKPETHGSTKHSRSTTKRPTTKHGQEIGNIKPGGFGGHNEVDW